MLMIRSDTKFKLPKTMNQAIRPQLWKLEVKYLKEFRFITSPLQDYCCDKIVCYHKTLYH